MVVGGAISRDVLEKAVGDNAVALAEALVTHGAKLPAGPWLEFGIRSGLARLNHTKVTPAFIRDLKLPEKVVTALVASWTFPFAKNAYGQILVAVIPEVPTDESVLAHLGTNSIRCVATLPELAELKTAYLQSV